MPVGNELNVIIRTGITSPVVIALAKSLLDEAGIPFFTMDRSIAPRQESGNFLGFWTLRVPREREGEAREILRSLEEEGAPQEDSDQLA